MKFRLSRSTEIQKAHKKWLSSRKKKESAEKDFEVAGEKLKICMRRLIREASIEFNMQFKKEGSGIIFIHHYIEGVTLPLHIEIFIEPETADENVCEQFNAFMRTILQKELGNSTTSQVRPDPRGRKSHRLQIVHPAIR